jgi:hypothetical protein
MPPSHPSSRLPHHGHPIAVGAACERASPAAGRGRQDARTGPLKGHDAQVPRAGSAGPPRGVFSAPLLDNPGRIQRMGEAATPDLGLRVRPYGQDRSGLAGRPRPCRPLLSCVGKTITVVCGHDILVLDRVPLMSDRIQYDGDPMAKAPAKRPVRREWTKEDVRELKAHSRSKTPVAKISKLMKRTIGALRQKALALSISLGHRR